MMLQCYDATVLQFYILIFVSESISSGRTELLLEVLADLKTNLPGHGFTHLSCRYNYNSLDTRMTIIVPASHAFGFSFTFLSVS